MAGCTPSLCSRTFTVGQYRYCPCIFRMGRPWTTDLLSASSRRVESNYMYRDVHSDCNEKLQQRFYDDCWLKKSTLRLAIR